MLFYFLFTLILCQLAAAMNRDAVMSVQRLSALRALMASQPKAISAYIVPTADAHNSEYISAVDARREWLTGFTGSAGTAVVTAKEALVWTDGRYYAQFEKEVDLKCWTLMKQSLPETPTMEKWLSTHLLDGAIVAADATTMSRKEWTPLKNTLKNANMELLALNENLVDHVRRQMNDPPPKRPENPIFALPVKYSGKTAAQKLSKFREMMVEKHVAALVVTALDEIAYVLNLRGSDIEYNPVFYSYLIIKPKEIVLFWQNGVLNEEIVHHLKEQHLDSVTVKPYNEVFSYLENFSKELSLNGDTKHSIWLSHDSSEAIHIAASGGPNAVKEVNLISELSPVELAKYIKNDVELQGFRDCHVRDGIAVVRFFKWLHDQIDQKKKITEIEASDQLLKFRQQEALFMGPSFSTIPGSGPNGAIIHYHPSSEGEQYVVQADNMFLLDSGGQYFDGTTDITRTRHMSSNPSVEQKDAFTRVLKGQIQLGTAVFPEGVKGNVLDTLARKSLWDVGLDYAHGTGHGVGHFLNVHEGPSGISWRVYPDDPGVKAGAIFSNEPGYYENGKYGIRHEDLVEVIKIDKQSDHPRAKSIRGDFSGRGVLGFRTLTLVPNQKECIDVNLLDDFELDYTNAYHKRVFNILGPILKQRGLVEDLKWLEKECQPISRDMNKNPSKHVDY